MLNKLQINEYKKPEDYLTNKKWKIATAHMTSRYSLNSWKGDASIFLCQEISLTMFDMGKFLLVPFSS